MFQHKRMLLSQNFFHSRKLVASLVGSSSITKKDLVLEIGPGRGIITQELLEQAHTVIAVELDPELHDFTQELFQQKRNFILYRGDFLDHKLPKIPYKVFANVPFAIEGKIIRKLLEAENPPADCYLVIMKALGLRLARNIDTMFSMQHRPWFDFTISHEFRSFDFTPEPQVQAVLFRFTQKSHPFLPYAEKKRYQKFIETGFIDGQPIRNNLKRLFSPEIVDNVLQKFSLSKKTKPGQVKLELWIKLYKMFYGLR